MIHQPRCNCLQCTEYSFVYNSVFDTHECLECALEVQAKYVNNLVMAFGVYKKEPYFIQNYNALHCLSCLLTGGIYFRQNCSDVVYCDICKRVIPIKNLHRLMTTAYETRLIEESYNRSFWEINKK